MTKAEMEKHRREGHVNYHPGCKHCVKSRAIADQHRRGQEHGHGEADDGRLPTISADLFYMGTVEEEDHLVGIALVDNKSDIIFAHQSPDKAIINGEYSEYILCKVVDDINSLGYDRINFKTDQEVAMTALQGRVQRM